MACGVAVIGSTCGELPEVIGDAGLTFPESDVGELAAALERLAGDPELRARLGANGRGRVLAEFSHDRIARGTVAVYRDVLRESVYAERSR